MDPSIVESEDNSEFQHSRRLSLIDVSFEDDSLYTSSSPPRESSDKPLEYNNVLLMEDAEISQILEDSFGCEEQVLKEFASMEPESIQKNEKYNLRKSLTWDSAFFTSEGVLEPEELSSIIGSAEKSEKHTFPGIEKAIHRSSDSLSALASDNLELEILEADLFRDIRASIEKAGITSRARNSSESEGSESAVMESQVSRANPAQVMLRNNVPAKNSNSIIQELEKTTKQFVATSAGPTSPLHKPTKLSGRITPVIARATKRVSMIANYIKIEKEHAKTSTVAGKGVKTRAHGSSQSTVHKSTVASKVALGSSTANPEILMSSLVDSSGSLSSDSSSNVKRKIDSRTSDDSLRKGDSKPINDSSRSNVKAAPRVMTRNKSQTTNSNRSPYAKSINKCSSSTSPASSVSEWSPESQSPTSTLIRRSNSSSSVNTVSANDANRAPRILNFEKNSNGTMGYSNQLSRLLSDHAKEVSTGSRGLHPDSLRPSRLRMPSSKIGFFDGVKAGPHTAKVNMQSHPALPSGLPGFKTECVNPSGGPNKGKLGKLQPGKIVAVRGTKNSTTQASFKSKSPSDAKKNSNSSTRVLNASTNGTVALLAPERGEEHNCKAEEVQSKRSIMKINNKKETCFEDQVNCLWMCFQATDFHHRTLEEPDSNSQCLVSRD